MTRGSLQLELSEQEGQGQEMNLARRWIGWRELIVRTLALVLMDLGSHWNVLNRDVMPSELGFNRLHLLSGQRIDYGKTRVEAERPPGKLLQ